MHAKKLTRIRCALHTLLKLIIDEVNLAPCTSGMYQFNYLGDPQFNGFSNCLWTPSDLCFVLLSL